MDNNHICRLLSVNLESCRKLIVFRNVDVVYCRALVPDQLLAANMYTENVRVRKSHM